MARGPWMIVVGKKCGLCHESEQAESEGGAAFDLLTYLG